MEGNGLYIRLGENDDAGLVITKVRDQLVGGLRVDGFGTATTSNASGETLCLTTDADGAGGAAEKSRGKAEERNGLHGEKRPNWDQPGGLKQETEKVKKEVMFGMKIDSGDIGKVLYSCVLSGIETVDIN